MTEKQITHIRHPDKKFILCLIKMNNSISFYHALKNPANHVNTLRICYICWERFLDMTHESDGDE